MRLGILISISLLLIFLVIYFSWLPDPDIGLKSYFPVWLGKWTNENPNLRTAVPFLILGFVGEIALMHNKRIWINRIMIIQILIAIVSIAELGQLYLPFRHFDLYDISWGLFGSLTGMSVGLLCKTFFVN